MNIFYLSHDVAKCAMWHVDKHVVKMILETSQLLSTAHRLIDGLPEIEERYVAGSMPACRRLIKRWSLLFDELRKQGHTILTTIQKTSDGKEYAEYSLIRRKTSNGI